MKMFFSGADAVTLWESKCRLSQEDGRGALLACPAAAPGAGLQPLPGVRGGGAALGSRAEGEESAPLLFSWQL